MTTSVPPAPEHAIELAQADDDVVPRLEVVERRVGEDGVEALVGEGERAHVRNLCLDVLRAGGGGLHHGRRLVDADELGTALGDDRQDAARDGLVEEVRLEHASGPRWEATRRRGAC